MTLHEAITAAGMTPPAHIPDNKWVRFPGVGKKRSNRSGWCRLVTPTLAIFGDWSSNFRDTWRDDAHQDDKHSAERLREAQRRERVFASEQRRRQANAATQAAELIRDAHTDTHAYLERKGFPLQQGLVSGDTLLIPMRDALQYSRVVGVQQISPDGEKRFLSGARAKAAIYRLGKPNAARTLLCEGYATGLTLSAAMSRLPRSHAVVVCFSAGNLETVATHFPDAIVCADNDASEAGQNAAKRTGLKWVMPPEIGDFNDLHQQRGLHAVVDILRGTY